MDKNTLEGTGLTSGDSYVANIQAQISTQTDLDPVTMTGEATIIASGLLIGQGSLSNQVIEEHAHLTINANGIVTATVTNVRMACQVIRSAETKRPHSPSMPKPDTSLLIAALAQMRK